jgi:hypothetical protein
MRPSGGRRNRFRGLTKPTSIPAAASASTGDQEKSQADNEGEREDGTSPAPDATPLCGVSNLTCRSRTASPPPSSWRIKCSPAPMSPRVGGKLAGEAQRQGLASFHGPPRAGAPRPGVGRNQLGASPGGRREPLRLAQPDPCHSGTQSIAAMRGAHAPRCAIDTRTGTPTSAATPAGTLADMRPSGRGGSATRCCASSSPRRSCSAPAPACGKHPR